MDNYNYPLGADTPDAPWNQSDPEPKEFDCKVTYSMEADSTYMTDEYDGDGDSLLDWKDRASAWMDSHKTPIELLDCLHEYLQNDLESVCERIKDYPKDKVLINKKAQLERLIADCLSWSECDFEAY